MSFQPPKVLCPIIFYAKKLLGKMLTAGAKYENKETIIIQRGK
jgi:hypothetical protein